MTLDKYISEAVSHGSKKGVYCEYEVRKDRKLSYWIDELTGFGLELEHASGFFKGPHEGKLTLETQDDGTGSIRFIIGTRYFCVHFGKDGLPFSAYINHQNYKTVVRWINISVDKVVEIINAAMEENYVKEAVSHGQSKIKYTESELTLDSVFKDWINAIDKAMDLSEFDYEGFKMGAEGKNGDCWVMHITQKYPGYPDKLLALFFKDCYYTASFYRNGTLASLHKFRRGELHTKIGSGTYKPELHIKEINDLII